MPILQSATSKFDTAVWKWMPSVLGVLAGAEIVTPLMRPPLQLLNLRCTIGEFRIVMPSTCTFVARRNRIACSIVQQ